MANCLGKTPTGAECPAPAQLGNLYCLWHDPERIEEAALARAKGGYARKIVHLGGKNYPTSIRTPEDLLALADAALADCVQMDGNIARMQSIVSLINAYKDILSLVKISEKLEGLQELINANKITGKYN